MQPLSIFLITCMLITFMVIVMLNRLFFVAYKKQAISKSKLITFGLVAFLIGLIIILLIGMYL